MFESVTEDDVCITWIRSATGRIASSVPVSVFPAVRLLVCCILLMYTGLL